MVDFFFFWWGEGVFFGSLVWQVLVRSYCTNSRVQLSRSFFLSLKIAQPHNLSRAPAEVLGPCYHSWRKVAKLATFLLHA